MRGGRSSSRLEGVPGRGQGLRIDPKTLTSAALRSVEHLVGELDAEERAVIDRLVDERLTCESTITQGVDVVQEALARVGGWGAESGRLRLTLRRAITEARNGQRRADSGG